MAALPSIRLFRAPLRAIAACIALSAWLVATAHAAAFDFEDVGRRAAALAAHPYKAPSVALPKALRALSYDQYRDIRFKPAKSIWRAANLPFELQLFHPGLYYDQPVRISEIVGGTPREIRFDPELFDYGKTRSIRRRCGASASRAFACTSRSTVRSTRTRCWCSRARRISARSAATSATDCRRAGSRSTPALASGEEFPRFVEFWIERPEPAAKELTIYGLLDSQARDRRLSLRAAARQRDA